MWGLSFKANTDDIREAASLTIINTLTADGMRIQAYDPQAARNAKDHLADNPLVSIVDDQYEVLQNSDALAVVTDWNQFRNPDFSRIKQILGAPTLFDGRNLYAAAAIEEQGFVYYSIGRAVIK
jgi:UDPglucose 6-dehydrogenase